MCGAVSTLRLSRRHAGSLPRLVAAGPPSAHVFANVINNMPQGVCRPVHGHLCTCRRVHKYTSAAEGAPGAIRPSPAPARPSPRPADGSLALLLDAPVAGRYRNRQDRQIGPRARVFAPSRPRTLHYTHGGPGRGSRPRPEQNRGLPRVRCRAPSASLDSPMSPQFSDTPTHRAQIPPLHSFHCTPYSVGIMNLLHSLSPRGR